MEEEEIFTVVNKSVDSENHQPLQPLDELGFTGSDGVLLAHPPLHHLVKLVARHGAHPHQQGVGLGQGEPAPPYRQIMTVSAASGGVVSRKVLISLKRQIKHWD